MPDQNHNYSILKKFTQDDYETAASAAFSDSSAESRLIPLIDFFRSLADSYETLLTRPELPDGLRVRLKRLAEVRPQWTPPGFEPAAVGLARLVSESETADFEFGYRGTSQRERLIFNSEIGEIELDISEAASGNRFVIRCQIDPDDPLARLDSGEAFLVPIAHPDHAMREVFDENGYFSITTDPGAYDLTIVCGSHAIRLPGIEVG